MAPRKAKAKTTTTTENMSQPAIRKLVMDSLAEAIAIERAEVAARAADTASHSGTAGPSNNRRECTYKDFKNGDPIKFKGNEGAIGLIRWFENMENVFLMCNCPEESKVKFSTGMLLETAMSWWNSYAQPIGMENAYKLTWDQYKKMMTKKFCPRTEIQKLETEFYELMTKGRTSKLTFKDFKSWQCCAQLWFPILRRSWKILLEVYPRASEGM